MRKTTKNIIAMSTGQNYHVNNFSNAIVSIDVGVFNNVTNVNVLGTGEGNHGCPQFVVFVPSLSFIQFTVYE